MNHVPTAQPNPADPLHAVLRSRGFHLDDFRLEQSATSDLPSLLGIDGGILTVHCRSTGEERLYSTGSGSAWLGAFLMDLGKGCFAQAARSADASRLPLSQAVPARSNA